MIEERDMPDPSLPDDRKPIADAASLFDTDEVRHFRPPAAPGPAGAPAPGPADGYALDADPFPVDDEPPRPVALPTPAEPARPRPKKPKPRPAEVEEAAPGDTSEFETELSAVDPVWTRGAEWGPDLVRVGLAGLGTLVLAWLASGSLLLAFFVLVLGGAATALLSYPILITLERPVRITPEQAVTDFFAAASHRVPHYRRMWLLLSMAGRGSGPFPDFGSFRDHWSGRVEAWRAGRGAGKFAPLEFEVEDFRADKSTGKATSRADYTVRVRLRDQPEAGPIESFRMAHGLVKGPDRMWYLNRGSLPAGPG